MGVAHHHVGLGGDLGDTDLPLADLFLAAKVAAFASPKK
jgi:hypothetical protein